MVDHSSDYISELIWLELTDQISEEQLKQLVTWSQANDANRSVFERIKFDLAKNLLEYKKIDVDEAWSRLEQSVRPSLSVETPTLVSRRKPFYWAAALLLVFAAISLMLYTLLYKSVKEESQVVADILPGKNGAILTLSDGKRVLLDTMKNGELELEGGVKVAIVQGKIIYDDHNVSHPNTISTDKGRQYSLVLSDGTKVWLNSASSIRFPTMFDDNRRLVEVSGEVYFEVAKDHHKPFYVMTPQGMEIKVTGTRFNLNTYSDEDFVKATLLEGRIIVLHRNQSKMLSPGEEARLSNVDRRAQINLARNVDVAKVTAWKDGLFNFDNEPLQVVMRQLERWYDIQVIYPGKIPDTRFFGEISRNENLKDVLLALQESGVRFKLEKERRLIVLDN